MNEDSSLEVLDWMPQEKGQVLIHARLHGCHAPIRAGIFEDGGPTNVQLFDELSGTVTCRVTQPIPEVLLALQKSEVPRPLPFSIRGGETIWSISGIRAQLDGLVRDLEKVVDSIEILSIGNEAKEARLTQLTDRQLSLLQYAASRGYFDVPRGISLTSLANQLRISKGTLSRELARGERKVLVSEGVVVMLRPGRDPSPP
jgi:hypothetical protein